ncbi:MAG: hypothetical protein WC813_04710 [Patescibacteria group bacterium]|jgi:hypothetical protein
MSDLDQETDMDELRGGPKGIRAMMDRTVNGRPFITRHNLSALGVREPFGTRLTLRVVTTRTTDSRKDEFAEIFKVGYFHVDGLHHLLFMYDWNIPDPVMKEVIAPLFMELFDYADGDLLTSALLEIISTTERIKKTESVLTWIQRYWSGTEPKPEAEDGQTDEVSLIISLLTLEERAGKPPKWRLRQATKVIDDFHVSPKGRLAVLSAEQAFEVNPRAFVRAIKGAGARDEDFMAAKRLGVKVGPNAVLSRYTPDDFQFNIPVYDNGALTVYHPDTGKVLFTRPSDRFIMTAADGTGSLIALERTQHGRRKVAPARAHPGQETLPLHAH